MDSQQQQTQTKGEQQSQTSQSGQQVDTETQSTQQCMGYSHKFDFKNLNKDATINMLRRHFDRDTYRLLGLSGIKMSRVCLGTMNFGNIDEKFGNRPGQLDENAAHTILDRYVELGGNCIDTANFFPWFGSTIGESERIIGNWLSKRKDRDQLIIITKIGMPTCQTNVNATGLGRSHVIESVGNCLCRLQTNYIDLLQIQGWDYSTHIKETVRVFDELLASGKVRNMGLCDFKAWQLQRIIDTSKSLNKHRFVCCQGEYNLLSRGPEMEVVDVCLNHNLGFIAYSPFKYGFLAGSYDTESSQPEQNTRIEAASSQETNFSAMAESFELMKTNPCFKQLHGVIESIAKHNNITMAQVALKWLLKKEFVSTVVVGVSSVEELEESMSVLTDCELTHEEMVRLDCASQTYLPYPYLAIPTNFSREYYMHSPGPVIYSQLTYLAKAITINDRLYDFTFDDKHFDREHIRFGMKHEKQSSKKRGGKHQTQQEQQVQQVQQGQQQPQGVQTSTEKTQVEQTRQKSPQRTQG